MKVFNSICCSTVLLGAVLLAPSASARDRDRDRDCYRPRHRHHDRNVSVSIGFGVPAPYYAPRPYYGPPAVVYSRPVYVDERPVYYSAPRPVNLDLAVQRALARRGYYGGVIDGDIGPQTRAAIRVYQVDRGLPVSGRVDGNLLRSLDLL